MYTNGTERSLNENTIRRSSKNVRVEYNNVHKPGKVIGRVYQWVFLIQNGTKTTKTATGKRAKQTGPRSRLHLGLTQTSIGRGHAHAGGRHRRLAPFWQTEGALPHRGRGSIVTAGPYDSPAPLKRAYFVYLPGVQTRDGTAQSARHRSHRSLLIVYRTIFVCGQGARDVQRYRVRLRPSGDNET